MSLSIENISAGYGNIQVLWGVSLKIHAGDIVSLIGANGSGKSTLLKTILGVVKSSAGSISLDGVNLRNQKTHSIIRKGIGYVPEGRRLFPSMSVEDNLRMGASGSERSLRDSFERIFELFPVLVERRKQLAGTLSGGEQQMVAIGRALMANPRVLLLDELSFGLAPTTFERVISAILEINKRGVSILLAEQNSERALEVSKRAYVLENGRITIEGPSENLIDDPKIKQAYLGMSS